MIRSGQATAPRICRWQRFIIPALILALFGSIPPALSGEAAPSLSDLEAELGITIFPGAELLALDGPSREVVDLDRPGWEFVPADVLVADFLVSAPITELRRFYRPLCVRDPRLLLVKKDGDAGEIVSLRHSGRHPLHPRRRWLRIVTYRLIDIPTDEPEGRIHLDGE